MRDTRVGTQFGGVWADATGRVLGFGKDGRKFGEGLTGYHYIGLQILSSRMFRYLPDGESNILYDALTAAIAKGETVRVVVGDFSWFETGNPHDFLRATDESLDLLARPESHGADAAFLHQTVHRFAGSSQLVDRADTRLINVDISVGTRVLLGRDSVIESGASLSGFVVIGEGACIQTGAIVENSVVLPGATVASGQQINDQIVTPSLA
jgi:mannose-1-phosphate guanylyltransferase